MKKLCGTLNCKTTLTMNNTAQWSFLEYDIFLSITRLLHVEDHPSQLDIKFACTVQYKLGAVFRNFNTHDEIT